MPHASPSSDPPSAIAQVAAAARHDWQAVVQRYEGHRNWCAAALVHCQARWNRLAYVRGILFLLSAAAAFLAWRNQDSWGGWGWLIAAVVGGLFLWVVGIHDQVERDLDEARSQERFFRQGFHRCHRHWDQLDVPQIGPLPWAAAMSRDLDLFGRASLVQLLGTVKTSLGLTTLQNWLSSPAPPLEIAARQPATAELAAATEWRESLQRLCDRLAASPSGPDSFVRWAGEPTWLDRFWPVRWLALGSAAAALVFLVGFLSGILPPPVCGLGAIGVVFLNFVVSVAIAGRIHGTMTRVSSSRNELEQYLQLFRAVQNCPAQAAWLRQNQLAACGEHSATLHQLQRLSRIVWLGNLRRHGILFLAYVVLQLLFLWDVHVFDLLERWQRRHGPAVRGWFEALGRIESAAALGTLAYENPSFTLPTLASVSIPSATVRGRMQIEGGGDRDGEGGVPQNEPIRIVGRQMGHPLLVETRRVPNDVELGPAGRVLLVTGSNMSGKSTLLRAVGVNLVLAQMGSVVCAQHLQFPPVLIETSMRIADSLADGVSFFMAELKRLKEIVDHAERISQRRSEWRATDGNSPPPTMLFLLDEILQGTNSRERHLAVQAVIDQLLRSGAIGAVTTHDLDLANSTTGLAAKAHTVYFTEHFEEAEGQSVMKFDYAMREGIAPTTNAIKLMRLVGLACD